MNVPNNVYETKLFNSEITKHFLGIKPKVFL